MAKVITDKEKIREVLNRGVENIYPSREALENVLLSGKQIRIYMGIDPTGKLHIGHGVVLKKLREFQDLGHEIIVLIGDFTARIGDPTDKLATRKKLTKEQVTRNAAGYKKLIGKILDFKKSKVRFLHNEEWTNRLKPVDMLELSSYFTVSRLLERDMFQKRIKEGKEIYLHEFIYPLFQAYDCVTMDVDMEIGGNDQTFNMLAGRTLMRKMKNKEKFVLTAKLLVDPTGKKMGKTEGNMVNLDEKPNDMYGQIMSWPDGLIGIGFEICTNLPFVEVKRMQAELDRGKINPRDLKMKLAYEIVKIYHGEKKAEEAQEYFIKTIQKKEIPEKIKEYEVEECSMKTVQSKELPKSIPKEMVKFSGDKMESVKLVWILANSGLANSRSEARRLIKQNAIKVDGQVINDINYFMPAKREGVIIQRGKRQFARVKLG